MKVERYFEGEAVSPTVIRLMAGRERIERCWVGRTPSGSHEHCAWTACVEEEEGQIPGTLSIRATDYLLCALNPWGDAGVSIPMWNDAPGRTKADVLSLYDRAIALALNDHA